MSVSTIDNEFPFVIVAQLVDRDLTSTNVTEIEPFDALQTLRDTSDVIISEVNSVLAGGVDWIFEPEQGPSDFIFMILDGAGVIPIEARILQEMCARHIVIATTRLMSAAKREILADLPHSDVWVLPTDENGQPDVLFLLSVLGKHEFAQVLVEDTALTESFLQIRPSTNAPIADQVRYFAAKN